MTGAVHVWRHPAAPQAAGRCIGHTDLVADPRKTRRLARTIARFAQRNALPRIVVTSPLRRSRAVGRWLARRGWVHRVDAALLEVDFGDWDGRPWSAVPVAQIDAWCADFAAHAPGGGESVAALLQRVRRWCAGDARIAVGHGGWMSAALWLADRGERLPRAGQWPPAPRHGHRIVFVPPR